LPAQSFDLLGGGDGARPIDIGGYNICSMLCKCQGNHVTNATVGARANKYGYFSGHTENIFDHYLISHETLHLALINRLWYDEFGNC
jgi:hypothetical protein